MRKLNFQFTGYSIRDGHPGAIVLVRWSAARSKQACMSIGLGNPGSSGNSKYGKVSLMGRVSDPARDLSQPVRRFTSAGTYMDVLSSPELRR